MTLPIAESPAGRKIKEPEDRNPGEGGTAGSCQVQAVSQPQLLFMNNFIAALMCNAYYGYIQGVFQGKLNDQGKPKYDEAYADLLLNRTNPRQRS